MRVRTSLVGSVVALLVASACGSGAEAPPAVDAAPAPVVSDVGRVEPPPRAPVGEVVAAIGGFGFELQRLVGEEAENLVFSPASIALAFSMAHAGADDPTQASLERAFGVPGDPGLYEAMNALLRELDLGDDDAVLEVASSGWAQAGREIGAAYLDTLARHFGAGLEALDLQGDPEGSRARINRWVAERTRDRIPELVPEGFVDPLTVYVLVNAIYLKAEWAQVFGKYPTEAAPFTRPDGSTVTAELMRDAELQGRHLVEDGLAAVELPMAGGELAMRIVVPDDLAGFEEGLDAGGWARIDGALQDGIVDVSLPRWDVDTAIDLAEPLNELGVEIPGGDYSGIAPGLVLGEAVHGADITVDEQGVEAAAGTALGFEESGPPPPDAVVRVDRPFLFAIVHRPTGLLLFLGHVVDPTALGAG